MRRIGPFELAEKDDMRHGLIRAIAAIGMVAVVVAAGRSSAAARRPGSVLVHEAFTADTADARFVGYGAACLTGAPRGGKVAEATNHPLGGCHPDPAALSHQRVRRRTAISNSPMPMSKRPAPCSSTHRFRRRTV